MPAMVIGRLVPIIKREGCPFTKSIDTGENIPVNSQKCNSGEHSTGFKQVKSDIQYTSHSTEQVC